MSDCVLDSLSEMHALVYKTYEDTNVCNDLYYKVNMVFHKPNKKPYRKILGNTLK